MGDNMVLLGAIYAMDLCDPWHGMMDRAALWYCWGQSMDLRDPWHGMMMDRAALSVDPMFA